METSENSIYTLVGLLFKRLDHSQTEVVRLKEEFELKFQALKKSSQFQSSPEFFHSKKDILEKFKQLLQYSCVDDAQSMYLNFAKELDVFISIIKNGDQYDKAFTNSNLIESEAKALFSSNNDYILLSLSNEYMKIQKELNLRRAKFQILQNMTLVCKNDSCLDQLNDFIKKDIYGQEATNNNIKSAMKLANDVQSVIDIMNQSIKDS